MHIQDSINLVGTRHQVAFSLAPVPRPISGREQDQLTAFGDMVVDFGGTITADGLTLTLPTDERLVPAQLPIQYNFDIDDYEDDDEANDAAVLWRNTIKTRIQEALTELMARVPGTVGTSINNIQPS